MEALRGADARRLPAGPGVKPLLFVTGNVPAYRVGALARLHECEDIEVALFGGRSLHGGPRFEGELPFPHREVAPRALHALAASPRHRAVVCPTGGRLAPLATWSGARRGGQPLILWASLWAHPRTAAHALTYLPLRRLYRSANAVVTYGPHVSEYVKARGARNVHIAPQSVDNDFWGSQEVSAAQPTAWPPQAATRFLFVGRDAPEKGLEVLLGAWKRAALPAAEAALALVGTGASVSRAPAVQGMDPVSAGTLRDLYAAADVLIVPSIETRTFREPWGLVVNEAMNRGLAVITSDAVGAAAGGLVRNGENGLVVGAGDEAALARAIVSLARDPELRARLGAQGARDIEAFDHEAWARGFSEALSSLGLARDRC
jgi:glycosyltransferase involved in cell wall biosynthesis